MSPTFILTVTQHKFENRGDLVAALYSVSDLKLWLVPSCTCMSPNLLKPRSCNEDPPLSRLDKVEEDLLVRS